MMLVAAPSIWLAHFTLVYVLLSLACASGAVASSPFGVGVLPLGVAAATAVALSLIGGVAWRARTLERPDDGSRAAWVARLSFILCGVSALAVAWVAYPAFVLPPCVS